MHLSADQYEALIKSIRPGPSIPDDKRKHQRTDAQGDVMVICLEPDTPPSPVAVNVMDVSAGGIAFLHDSELRPGQEVIICLNFDSAEQSRAIMAIVRRTCRAGNGLFSIGCEFAGDLPSERATDEILMAIAEAQPTETQPEIDD